MDIKKFLKEEISNPLQALKFTALFSLKFIALWFLRLILWIFFFFLPVILFLMFGAHYTTEIMRKKDQEIVQVQQKHGSVTSQAESPFWSLKSLSYDLRYWKRELEKFGW